MSCDPEHIIFGGNLSHKCYYLLPINLRTRIQRAFGELPCKLLLAYAFSTL